MSLYPALPADTGHSDGCAAANRGASGDGLRPAGADTPGSGVTAALCQCHDCFTAYRFACHSQGCLYFYFSRTHLCCLVHHFPPKHVLQLHVPQHSVFCVSLRFLLLLSWLSKLSCACVLLLKASLESQMFLFSSAMAVEKNMQNIQQNNLLRSAWIHIHYWLPLFIIVWYFSYCCAE